MAYPGLCLRLIIAACLLSLCAHASAEDAISILKNHVPKETLSGKKVYMMANPLPRGGEIRSWRSVYRPPAELCPCWVFFIDDNPPANWEHPARLVFIEKNGDRSRVFNVRTPPDNLPEMEPLFQGNN